ncbi:hypothetical protein GCM10023215_54620 [Pseudonocardia yuanmonensis]|uniref:Uncharacterized protein n=1 Tax=Pseudonocardia yuanmonensis TaxID=1095914 RepID=A0ABP8XJE4_9PSEU
MFPGPTIAVGIFSCCMPGLSHRRQADGNIRLAQWNAGSASDEFVQVAGAVSSSSASPGRSRLHEQRRLDAVKASALPARHQAAHVRETLDPTGKGRARWAMRWKPALNAFAITFAGRIVPSNGNQPSPRPVTPFV